MLTKTILQGLLRVRDDVTDSLLQTSIRPNTLTAIGVLLVVPVAVLIAYGYLFWAALLFLVAASFDMLDGSVAKAGNRTTRFGAFLDSTLDRIADMLLFGGIAAYFIRQGSIFPHDDAAFETIQGAAYFIHPGSLFYLFLTALTLAFSLMISYTRARAECLIPKCGVGLAERPERMALLFLGLLCGSLPATLWILAILTFVTFVHRVVYTWYETSEEEYPPILNVVFLDFPRGSEAYDVLFVGTFVIILIFGIIT